MLSLLLSALRRWFHDRRVFDEDEPTEVVIRPWTPVRSARGKFIHMCHDGRTVLCNVRIATLIPSPDDEIDCLDCHNALTFN